MTCKMHKKLAVAHPHTALGPLITHKFFVPYDTHGRASGLFQCSRNDPVVLWFRHGRYDYAKGTTSVVEERVKRVSEEDSEIGGLLTTTPMLCEVTHWTEPAVTASHSANCWRFTFLQRLTCVHYIAAVYWISCLGHRNIRCILCVDKFVLLSQLSQRVPGLHCHWQYKVLSCFFSI